jgi:vacuolar-type H+-ATPase subunit F/Vma7
MSKLRVVAVGEYPMIAGFALAGVSVVEADTREEAADDAGVVRPDTGEVPTRSHPPPLWR